MNMKILKSLSVGVCAASLLACTPNDADRGNGAIIYTAKAIVTVDENITRAKEVAVRDGMIIAVGDAGTLQSQLKDASVDKRFEGKTIIPGLIDPHVHIALGAMMYGLPMVPPWDVQTQDGTIEGLPDKAAFLKRVSEINAQTPGDKPLILYGFHNLVHGDLTRHDLSKITDDRPLIIWHYSGHDFYFNDKAITSFGYTPALAEKFHGVDLDADGELTGRIYEDAALAVFSAVGPYLLNPEQVTTGYEGFETILEQAGVTTIAEMGYGIFGKPLEDNIIAQQYGIDDAYRLYLVPEHRAFSAANEDPVAAMKALASDYSKIGTPKSLNQVKLFTDAAFYSQTMKLRAPGYVAGQSAGTDGLWVTQPEDLAEVISTYWDAGMDIHIHSNGDAAQDSTLAAFAQVKRDNPGADSQRLVIEHAGLLRPEQLDRAAKLGIGLSAASHYVNYMGQTYSDSIGSRVQFITPLASAAQRGMPVTLHSDAPLAPPQPLRAASVHITRATRQGGTSTASEQLNRVQGLRAVTLNAAWSLGLESELGSITPGKRADFTILDANPMEIAGEDWPDIGVWGVVIDGVVKPVK